ncbi:hypothetical protein GCM10010358_40150 [Streptomyces minutiscleroticus]|uniref:Uncharacterized protein n=1 Tax=Streptomyces minutiscleroticus TaxID=68238 RepID=A0A918U2I2_9ACTN|nr:hypothetical protein [Streptomyces minutiscleroticus]GGX81971.1 hypothetical protein GCM10010358_40150 [Streptomyces minutiscleroticus]
MTTPPPQAPQGQNPFSPQGQNPYAAQQPGQPGVPPQAGQPGIPSQPGAPTQPYPPFQQGGPGAPVPPPAPGRRVSKKVLRVVGFIVIAIVIALGKWYLGQSDAETTAVGSCMHNEGTQVSPDLKTVDCSSGDAEYKVVEKFENTSDDSKCESVKDATIAYYQTGNNHDVVLCLKEV